MTHIASIYATVCKVAVNKLAALAMRTTLSDPTRSCIGMFHDVTADGAPKTDEYAVSVSELIEAVESHQKAGFTFISLDALLSAPFADVRRRCSVLTFDDGYANVAALAAPMLFARNIPFTVYIATELIGQKGYLSPEALRTLSENPLCTVGSHLVTHRMTRFMSRSEVLAELEGSRATLERITGRPVRHMAFPFGNAYAVSLRDVGLARRAGYASAALTVPTVYTRCGIHANYRLPRLDRLRTD